MTRFRPFIVFFLIGFSSTSQSTAQTGGRPVPVDLALVLAVDVSGSVDEAEAALHEAQERVGIELRPASLD